MFIKADLGEKKQPQLYRQCISINSAEPHGVQSFGMAILQCDMHSVDQQQHTWLLQQWGYRQQLTSIQVKESTEERSRNILQSACSGVSGKTPDAPGIHTRSSGRQNYLKVLLCIGATGEVRMFARFTAKRHGLHRQRGVIERKFLVDTPVFAEAREKF